MELMPYILMYWRELLLLACAAMLVPALLRRPKEPEIREIFPEPPTGVPEAHQRTMRRLIRAMETGDLTAVWRIQGTLKARGYQVPRSVAEVEHLLRGE